MDKYSSKRSDARELFWGGADMKVCMKRRLEVRISVEGYDTSLPVDDINKALVNLFNSCGEVINVTIPIDPETRFVERRAFKVKNSLV